MNPSSIAALPALTLAVSVFAAELPGERYPIDADGLRPGYMRGARSVDLMRDARPIALVGADEMSRQWLALNHEYLNGINALVLLVEVARPESVAVLRAAAPKLIIVPTSAGHWFVEALGIDTYPALLDPIEGRVMQ